MRLDDAADTRRTVLRKYPIYLLLDVSESMRRPDRHGRSSLDAFGPMINELVLGLQGAAWAKPTVWIKVLAFSERVQVLREMTPLSLVKSFPDLEPGHDTDYAEALRYLADTHPEDFQRINLSANRLGHQAQIRPPLVFIITDGAPYVDGRNQPQSSWQRQRERLVDGPMQAWIAAISVRPEHQGTLWELATGAAHGDRRNAFLAKPGTSAAGLATSIHQCITASIKRSVRAGDRLMTTPDGMERAARDAPR
ncbi:VWA domain-containing protein [Actinoplanes sp. M2I2]|uniref:vWA domain-containing protein n=1 Tax=Actinoplanes sp. M2I2 TaxID=1734444 RepID=UPI0020201D8B|nr:VWA domain-containing protein [Actinoplanes sp. M2I2]